MNILYSVVSLIFVHCFVFYMANVKVSKKLVLLCLINSSVVLGITVFSELLASLSLVMGIIGVMYAISKKMLRSIGIVVVCMVILLLSDQLAGILLIHVFDFGFDFASVEQLRSRMDIYFFGYTIIILIAVIVGYGAKRLMYRNKMNIVSKRLMVAMISSVIFMFVILFVNSFFVSETEVYTIIIVLIDVFIFFLFGIEMYVLISGQIAYSEKQRKEEALEQLEGYTKNIEIFYKEMRKFQHDYVNLLMPIRSYIDEGDLEGLGKYFDNQIVKFDDIVKLDEFKLGALSNIKQVELKGIVSSKLIKARELGIQVQLEVEDIVERVEMKPIDLVRAIGILLDNAIEGCLQAKEKMISIAIIRESNAVIINVKNSIGYENMNINHLYKKGYSTKGEHRGVGLQNYKEILENYANVLKDTEVKDYTFTQSMTIMDE